MIRTIVLAAVLGVVGFIVVAWATGGPGPVAKGTTEQQPENPGTPRAGGAPRDQDPSAPPRVERTPGARKIDRGVKQFDPVIIPDVRVNIVDRQEVSSARSGHVKFLGVEVGPGEKVDPSKTFKESVPFVAVKATEAERAKGVRVYKVEGDKHLWRRMTEEDVPEPKEVRLLSEIKTFKPIQVGTSVRAGQLLGLVDPRVTVTEVKIKIAEFSAGQEKLFSTRKTRDEARTRYETAQRLLAQGAATREDVSGAKLTWERYVGEAKVEQENINALRSKLLQTRTLLELHEIRAAVDGEVREVLRHREEAVKELEPILRLENSDRLKLEGFIEPQLRPRLQEGMAVVVEPVREEGPAVRLLDLRQPVTAVAVSRGESPKVAAASDSFDGTVMIWDLIREVNPETKAVSYAGKAIYRLRHRAAVKSLACTPPGAKRNLLLAGAANGAGYLWDLDKLNVLGKDKEPKPVELSDHHSGAINAVAFSPSGELCVTGGDDHAICLWKVATGQLLHRIPDAHRGAVTSVQFTPDNLLVSAGRDKSLNVWKLEGGKELARVNGIDHRGGGVDQLGVSPDGADVLFDLGSEMRVLSLKDEATRGVIRHTSRPVNFSTLAMFSPDGKTVLTAGPADSPLQLWRNPAACSRGRAAELRRYVWKSAAATAAAFAPEVPVVVTGMQDSAVLIWELPPAEEVAEQAPNAVLTVIEEFQDNGQVRIVADVTRKTAGLIPGKTATVVIYPNE